MTGIICRFSGKEESRTLPQPLAKTLLLLLIYRGASPLPNTARSSHNYPVMNDSHIFRTRSKQVYSSDLFKDGFV